MVPVVIPVTLPSVIKPSVVTPPSVTPVIDTLPQAPSYIFSEVTTPSVTIPRPVTAIPSSSFVIPSSVISSSPVIPSSTTT